MGRVVIAAYRGASSEAIEVAHAHAEVHGLWARFDEACEYRTLASLAEARDMFAEFEPVEP